MGARTVLVAAGAAMVVAGVAGCGPAGSHAGGSAGSAHSVSRSPSQRVAGTPAQTGAALTGSGATGGGHDETVGIWPVRTRAQAIQLQQAVDAGHQPWLLDPTQVAVAYVRSEMNVSQPYLRRIAATRYVVRVAPTAETILTVVQPVRTGNGGIWVIVSATQERLSPGATASASGTPSRSQ